MRREPLYLLAPAYVLSEIRRRENEQHEQKWIGNIAKLKKAGERVWQALKRKTVTLR